MLALTVAISVGTWKLAWKVWRLEVSNFCTNPSVIFHAITGSVQVLDSTRCGVFSGIVPVKVLLVGQCMLVFYNTLLIKTRALG